MKVNLKNIIGLAALGITLLTTTAPTWAGRVYNDNVVIGNDQSSSWAGGSMVDARYSADSRQHISCRAESLPHYPWTTCYATDSAGRGLICGSASWTFFDMVQGMMDSSHILFRTDTNTAQGNCTEIVIYNSSEALR